MTVSRDVTERVRAEEMVWARARQQGAVAELGVYALSGVDPDGANEGGPPARGRDPCGGVVQSAPVAARWQGNASGCRCGLEGGTGRPRQVASTGLDSQAGYALLSNEPVIVEDLRTETRFPGRCCFASTGSSAASVASSTGTGATSMAVLGAHTRTRRRFTRDDAAFLQGVANVLATAIERKRSDEEKAELLRRVAEAATAAAHVPCAMFLARLPRGKLRLCDNAADLPPRLARVGEPIELSAEALRALRQRTLEAAREQGFDKDRGHDLDRSRGGEHERDSPRRWRDGVGRAVPSGTGAGLDRRQGQRYLMERLPAGHAGAWLLVGRNASMVFSYSRLCGRRLYHSPGLPTTVVIEQERAAPEPACLAGR